MSSQTAVANLRPFQPGPDPRRNVGGPLSLAERQWRKALEDEHIPRASALLSRMIDQGLEGDTQAAIVAFKVMGLVRKQTDDAAIQELAQKLLDGMIEEARQRRANGSPQP